MIKIEHNTETDEIIEIPLSKAEIAALEFEAANNATLNAEIEKRNADILQKRNSLAAKLGITIDELDLLI